MRSDPLADPGTAPPLRGGTVVEVLDGEQAQALALPGPMVRVVSGMPRTTSGKRQVRRITTAWYPLEEWDNDPLVWVQAQHRAGERCKVARAILEALGHRNGQPTDWDWRMLRWVVGLWLGGSNPGTIPTVGYQQEDDPS